MKASKLFHVLVLTGGALGVAACSDSGPDPSPQPAGQSSSSTAAAKDKDGGDDDETPPSTPEPPRTGGGSHFW